MVDNHTYRLAEKKAADTRLVAGAEIGVRLDDKGVVGHVERAEQAWVEQEAYVDAAAVW